MTLPDRYPALVLCGFLLFAAAPTAAQQQLTVQQPVFGVAVDADGVLTAKTFPAPGGALRLKRLMAAKAALPGDVAKPSAFRKVSLVRLAAAMRKRLDAGQPLDETMNQLVGLQRVQYVFLFPDQHDIVIAGPAEGWVKEDSGRVIGITTGAPTLRVEDLAVAMRAYPPNGPAARSVGCSIDPTAQGIARLREFQKTVPRRISDSQRRQVGLRILRGTREALGMGTVRVFGIPADILYVEPPFECRIGITPDAEKELFAANFFGPLAITMSEEREVSVRLLRLVCTAVFVRLCHCITSLSTELGGGRRRLKPCQLARFWISRWRNGCRADRIE